MIGRIELRYHSALKNMGFKRMVNNGWTDVNLERGKWYKYSPPNEPILQSLGEDFFDDLGESMDGIMEIKIDFKGPKLDHGDFINMINHYNNLNKKKYKFSVGEFIELKDMESLYQDIKLFSSEAIIALEDASRNNCLESTKNEIIERITALKEKQNKLEDKAVNLCFVGTYSSGKSTIINAILGYEILPEAQLSKTAKMFEIHSVKCLDDAEVSFKVGRPESDLEIVSLKWDSTLRLFYLCTEIHGNKIIRTVQECINENKNEPLYIQLRKILTVVNKQPNSPVDNPEYIKGLISVGFPIPLCGDVDFVFYDTPGSDSNYSEHLAILTEALEEQTNSILVFVNRPSKVEGTGNSMLIELLDQIEKNASKSTIDIGRSLYVINAADEIMKGAEGFNEIKTSSIKLLPKPQEESSQTDDNRIKENGYPLDKG